MRSELLSLITVIESVYLISNNFCRGSAAVENQFFGDGRLSPSRNPHPGQDKIQVHHQNDKLFFKKIMEGRTMIFRLVQVLSFSTYLIREKQTTGER